MGQSVNSALDVRPALQNDRMLRSGFEDFRSLAIFMDGPGDTTVPETTGPNLILTDKNVFEYEGVGTMDAAQPVIDSTGLLLTAVMTSNNVGVEIQPGLAAGTRHRGVYTIGTDDPFYMSVTFKLTDVSGTDFCFAGFRKVEARQTGEGALTYTDYALLAAISGDIKIYTSLNDGTEAITDTTQNWADAESHKLTVLVDSVGKVYFEIDGVAPTTEPATRFQFDNGDLVAPMFRIQNAADVAEATILTQYAWGFQGDTVAPRRYGTHTVGV